MNAVTYPAFGKPDSLEYGEVPKPKVPPGWVLIRVVTAGVNPVDWKMMTGSLASLFDTFFPVIPGWDVAGVVERVGLDTPDFAVGEEVVAYARKDSVQGGTFAEYVSVPARAVARRPRNVSWESSGALPLVGMTALRAVERIGAGTTGGGGAVVVNGAAGGVGRIAVRLLRDHGYDVIGTGAARNQELIRSLGATPVDYATDWVREASELSPEGFGAILDFGGQLARDAVGLLNTGGRLVSTVDPTVVKRGGSLSWLPADGELLARVVELVEHDRLAVPEPRVFALQDAAEALGQSMSGQVTDKLCLRVG